MRVVRGSGSFARFGVAALLGAAAGFAATPARAADASCPAGSPRCAVASTSVHGDYKQRFPTELDSGFMEAGPIKVRTRFTLDPVPGDPSIFSVDMASGAKVVASWSEAGTIELLPVTGEGAQGNIDVHFTLAPSLEGQIYGVSINYNASQLVSMLPGGRFNYESQAAAPLVPWGFTPAQVLAPAPALENSTIFALPFVTLGVAPEIAEGTLSIQAVTRPTFKYVTKAVRLNGVAASAGASAKIPVGDSDALEVSAIVSGEVSFSGTLDVRPVVQVDSVGGYPTFGLVDFSFSAVQKPYDTPPVAIGFAPVQLHIPLPNVKVPTTPLGMGDVKAGRSADKTVTITNSGEMAGVIEVQSSDPQFVVPSGAITIGSKGSYALNVAFKPTSDGPASANITVRSNDPDSPEQVFHVAANGAALEVESDDPKSSSKGHGPRDGVPALTPPPDQGGCSMSRTSSRTLSGGYGAAVGFALAGAAIATRRRRAV